MYNHSGLLFHPRIDLDHQSRRALPCEPATWWQSSPDYTPPAGLASGEARKG